MHLPSMGGPKHGRTLGKWEKYRRTEPTPRETVGSNKEGVTAGSFPDSIDIELDKSIKVIALKINKS